MNKVTQTPEKSSPASAWPAWTDAIRCELPADTWPSWADMIVPGPTGPGPGPDPCEARWAAAEFGTDFDDDDFSPPDEDRAIESAAMDVIESGLADMLSRTSLVGLADCDEVLHAGSDERDCLCEACVWTRTARFA